MTTGGRTSRTASSSRGRTAWWWYGTRTASGTMCPATTTWHSLAKREPVGRHWTAMFFWPSVRKTKHQQKSNNEHRSTLCFPPCFPLSFVRTAPGGQGCPFVWHHETPLRDQLPAPLPLQTRLHPETCAHHSLPRQRPMGHTEGHLHEPWVVIVF